MRSNLTVVTYCKGRLHHLLQCLPTVMAQTVPVDVIVVDYNCPDGAADQIERDYPDIKVIRCDVGPEEWNISRARNIGILAVETELVLFLDADTLLEPDCVEINLETLKDYGFGCHRGDALVSVKDAFSVGGYNEELKYGWGHDNGNFYARLMLAGLKPFQLSGMSNIEHGDSIRSRFQSMSITDSSHLNKHVKAHKGL